MLCLCNFRIWSLKVLSLLNCLLHMSQTFLLFSFDSFTTWCDSVCLFSTAFVVVLKPHILQLNRFLILLDSTWSLSLWFNIRIVELELKSQSSHFLSTGFPCTLRLLLSLASLINSCVLILTFSFSVMFSSGLSLISHCFLIPLTKNSVIFFWLSNFGPQQRQ